MAAARGVLVLFLSPGVSCLPEHLDDAALPAAARSPCGAGRCVGRTALRPFPVSRLFS
ncbi:hypothetical protein [Streptomyces werraensis]|uniref:hypothetical protein n=1 Tax=Streptomyces werraensis TaxID=68284 RepID=UPI003432022A